MQKAYAFVFQAEKKSSWQTFIWSLSETSIN